MTRLPTLLLLAVLLAGCASGPRFATDGVAESLNPDDVAAADQEAIGQRVLWGGRLLAVRPLEDTTQLELLAFPLNGQQRPDPGQTSQGRFLVLQEGFLEPTDWPLDRMVTVLGTIEEIQQGRIGQAEYHYPVIQAEDLQLWPQQSQTTRTQPRVNFGFGLILSN